MRILRFPLLYMDASALCSCSITVHANKETFAPPSERSRESVTFDRVSKRTWLLGTENCVGGNVYFRVCTRGNLVQTHPETHGSAGPAMETATECLFFSQVGF